MRRPDEPRLSSARFELREPLGRGGGGVVYRAYDRAHGREVAIKLMRDLEGDGCARFRASFPALKALSHPNLVELQDLVDDGAQTILVMELVEGVDLLEHIRRPGGGFDELRLRASFVQLAQALYALHREGKIHRDVKPSNVRVTPEGRVVLLDLDLGLDFAAERAHAEPTDGAFMAGTAVYMAPEQVSSKPLSPACDWYSVGVALYEALTGALPYAGSDLTVLLEKQHLTPRPPDELAPEAPADLARLCLDLLRPEPSERPRGTQILKRLGVPDEQIRERLSLASLLSARAPFVGREPEIERLMGALDRCRDGPVVVRLRGAMGAGKTTLCEEWLRRLAQDRADVLVLAARCPRHPTRPHASFQEPLARLIEALQHNCKAPKLGLSAGALSLLERMFGGAVLGVEERAMSHGGVPPDPFEQRFRAVSALRTLFAAAAEAQPVVLWLDSYQWADVDSQRLTASLVRGRNAPPMLVVLCEDTDAHEPPASLPPADELINLTELTQPEAADLTAELVQRVGASQPPPGLDLVPSPLMIQERVRYWLFFGRAAPPERDLGPLLDHRIAALSPESRCILATLAVAFDPLPQAVCQRACGLSRPDFSRHLSALRVGSLVRSSEALGEDWLTCLHPSMAVCIERSLTPGRRAELHRALALALLAHSQARASAQLLRHQLESGDSAAASESARVAAEEASAALAFQRAAALYTLSVSLAPPGLDQDRYQLLSRMADALGNAGWALSAAAAYREAAALATAADALYMRQRALDHYIRAFQIDSAMDVVRELLALFGLRTPGSPRTALWTLVARRALTRVRGYGFREVAEGQVSARELRRVDAMWAAASQFAVVDIVYGSELHTRALNAALEVGEPQRVARALCAEAWTLIGHRIADYSRTEQTLETARALVERAGSPLLDGHLRLALGMMDLGRMRLVGCLRWCQSAEQVFRDSCTDVSREQVLSQLYQLLCMLQTARFREVEARVETWLAEAQERGDRYARGQFACLAALGVKVVRDLPNEAAADILQAEADWGDGSRFYLPHLYALLTAVYVDLYRGSTRALDRLEARWPDLRGQFLLQLRFVRTALYELRGRARLLAYIKRRDSSLLRGAEADARRLLSDPDVPEQGLGLLLRAGARALRGEHEACVRDLQRALPLLEQPALHVWALPARQVLGELLGGEEGRTMQENAIRALQEQGTVNVVRFRAMMVPGFSEFLLK